MLLPDVFSNNASDDFRTAEIIDQPPKRNRRRHSKN